MALSPRTKVFLCAVGSLFMIFLLFSSLNSDSASSPSAQPSAPIASAGHAASDGAAAQKITANKQDEWKEFLKNRTAVEGDDSQQQRLCQSFSKERDNEARWTFPFAGATALSKLLQKVPRANLCEGNSNPFCGDDAGAGGKGTKKDGTDEEDKEQQLLAQQSKAHSRFLNSALHLTNGARKECRPSGPALLQDAADVITSTRGNPGSVCPAPPQKNGGVGGGSSEASSSSSITWKHLPSRVQHILTPLPETSATPNRCGGNSTASSPSSSSSSSETILEANCIVKRDLAATERADSDAVETGFSVLNQVVEALLGVPELHWQLKGASPAGAAQFEIPQTNPAASLDRNEDIEHSICLSVDASGPALAHIRQSLLKDRLTSELFLLSDAAFVVPFGSALPPMKNIDYFFNGYDTDSAAGHSRPVKFPATFTDVAAKTGGFPTFDRIGAQPGLYVAVFTRVVIGANYVFTCSGRMYGNGGAKEHRFEFAGTEQHGKSSSGRAAKLPCKPLSAAFSRSPVKVAVPLCTSRYCRWYGIYHFFLEHLPQLTATLDILQSNPAAVLVVTGAPSMTIRSLLVDALGIPPSRIAVGPLRADVALLPTPGLVYRPMSHALRIFRRAVLSRMGLEHRAVIDEVPTMTSSSSSSSLSSSSSASSSVQSNASITHSLKFSSSSSSSAAAAAPRIFPRRFCSGGVPEIRLLFSERTSTKATAEQKQVRLPRNWQEIKRRLRDELDCVRFQTEKEIREDVRDTIHAFYEADVVLGVHGANLLFVTFMRRGAHLIEMIAGNAELNPRCFFNLAAEVGVRYSALLHDGAFKLKEYNYVLNPAAVVGRVNVSIQAIRERILISKR